jgi:hypothetical protein
MIASVYGSSPLAQPALEPPPFARVALDVAAIVGERLETELARAAPDPPAHLAAHLAVAGPPPAQPRQRPLQERHAFGVGHGQQCG